MDYADLWLFSGTAEAGAMSGTLRVHLPEIPNEYRAFSRTEDGVDRELAAKMDENGALTVALEQLPAGALIGVRVVYPEGFFTRPASAGNWIALVAATALLVLFLGCISWANRVKYIRNLNCICNNILRSYSKWVILNLSLIHI